MKRVWIVLGLVAIFLLGISYRDAMQSAYSAGGFWSATAAASAATATATATAVASTRYVVTGAIATCAGAAAPATATITDGSTDKIIYKIINLSIINFDESPIIGSVNTNMVATLTTCGAGNEGRITLYGYKVFEP